MENVIGDVYKGRGLRGRSTRETGDDGADRKGVSNDEGKSRKGPRPIAGILQDVVARLGLEHNLDDFRLWQAWDEVVGPTVARNAQPLRLDGTRLVIAVRTNTWMQELGMLRGDITTRLNEWMGRRVISEIFLVAGRVDREPIRRASGAPVAARKKPASVAEAVDRLWQQARRNAPADTDPKNDKEDREP